MKKLMIAAAVAAMIGGVNAATATYQFVANLQTTVGQAGFDTWTSGGVNLGVSDANTMWYDDANINGTTYGTAFKYKTLTATHLIWKEGSSYAGEKYPTLYIVTTKVNGVDTPLLDENEKDALEELAATYKWPSYGKWCCQLQWWIKTPGTCFRVVGSEAIVDTLTFNTAICCVNYTGNGGYKKFYSANGFIDWDNGDNRLFKRFGAQAEGDAHQLEIFASIENYTYNAHEWFGGWLAGQGYEQYLPIEGAQNLFATVPVLLSGTIVGVKEGPRCPDCCVRPLPQAIAWNYCGERGFGGYGYTAAYGSWYLQLTKLVR